MNPKGYGLRGSGWAVDHQAIVNRGGSPTEQVIDQTRERRGHEYRDETEGEHPVADLRPQPAR